MKKHSQRTMAARREAYWILIKSLENMLGPCWIRPWDSEEPWFFKHLTIHCGSLPFPPFAKSFSSLLCTFLSFLTLLLPFFLRASNKNWRKKKTLCVCPLSHMCLMRMANRDFSPSSLESYLSPPFPAFLFFFLGYYTATLFLVTRYRLPIPLEDEQER